MLGTQGKSHYTFLEVLFPLHRLATMCRAVISLPSGDFLLDSLAILSSYLWARNHASLLNDAAAVIFVEVH